ncbi:ATP-dependent DNA helicase [Desulfonema limicola]|uniref:DNA 3'-5' helicase n=1 Tax=Desulfonema limicola TaxID=45656 RepID=A0A975GGN8_9BACT|nr:UvrD-helicase domain-containing protein [Desulfonema limicola]QTA80535.1 ATP-dependent DNA helicase [Desulfonema limicola]
MDLSQQQQDAVRHLGTPALVVAGAGSGKTRTLTAKIDYLIKKGYDPSRILAITFTNKAAEEMKTRLESQTGMPSYKFPWVKTYHSACYGILKTHCRVLGFNTPLQIYSGYQQQKLIKEILVGLNFDKKHVPQVQAHISNAKNSGNPDSYFELKSRIYGIRIKDVFNIYEKELKQRNAVDFDNILFLTRDILRDNKDIREKYQDFFQYILVDEYQDSNNLQEELTSLMLANGNLFCVGDDWQAIYGFRGSNVNHFLSFPDKYKNARIFRLEQNYRSADEIVQAANELIGYNEKKMDKKCFSEKKGGIVELHEFFDEYQEAGWVCKKVQALKETGVSYSSMAVLYRTKFCSLSFEKAFMAQNIPYQMMGSKGFFERKEILDINCYLTAAVFPKDDVAFDRIINTPKRGIGPGMLNKIAQARTLDMSLQEAARKVAAERILSPKVHKALTHLLLLLDKIRDMNPENAINTVLSGVDYMEYLKKYTKSNSMDYISREENIKELIHSARQHDNLIDYLEEASLVREDKDEDEENKDFGVKLSTIHASKGLEYYAVFIAGCEENLFPHWRSLDSLPGLQEERRLMYVAVTRAERYLYLSCSAYRRGQSNMKSRFWDEIEESLG